METQPLPKQGFVCASSIRGQRPFFPYPLRAQLAVPYRWNVRQACSTTPMFTVTSAVIKLESGFTDTPVCTANVALVVAQYPPHKGQNSGS
jgi:hypothetical protein